MATPQLLPAGPLYTSGNQIVDAAGNPQRLAAIGWAGAYTRNGAPDGLDSQNYQTILNAVKSIGFNAIRIGFCDAAVIANDFPASGLVNASLNPTLAGLRILSVFDAILAYCNTIGLRVIFDSHNNEGSNNSNFGANQPNGLWYDVGGASDGTDSGGNTGTVSQAAALQMWKTLATRWASAPALLGYDLRNEPNCFGLNGPGGSCTWGTGITNTDLRLWYQTAGNAIHAIDSRPLIICEGPQNYGLTFATGTQADGIAYGSGNVFDASCGDLSLVRSAPVVLVTPNKVVYSAHEYPQETSGSTLDNASQAKINNMTAVWGYIFKENIGPVWIGEMGSYFNGTAAQISASTSWMNMLISYMNGQTPGGPSVAGAQQGVGLGWWVLGVDENGGNVPDFGILTDWSSLTPRANQLSLYSQLFFYSSGAPIPPSNVSPNGTTIISIGPVITDKNGNTWGISSGGQVLVNGTADPTTGNVIELVYVSGLIYQENASGNWFSKAVPSDSWTTTSSPFGAAPVPSPNGTVVTTVGPAITDSNGNLWTITGGGNVAVNSFADASLSGVIEIAWVGGQIWAETNGALWYVKTLPSGTWSPPGGTAQSPLVASKPRVVAPLTGTVNTGAFVAQNITVSGVTLASGKQFHFEYLLPSGYNANVVYPVLIWLHPTFEGDPWYNGSNNNPNYLSAFDANGFYNNVPFRTSFPCIIVVPYADQTNAGSGDGNDAVENFGGWTNNGSTGSGTVYSGDTGPNVFALLGMVNWLTTHLSADPTRLYLAGFSLGAIGSEYLMLKYNMINGNPPVFAAATSVAGVLEIHGFGAGPSAGDITAMTNVPVWWVSGGQDGTSIPADWNLPMWRALAGNSNYPAPGGSPTQAQAGSSQYHFWLDPNIGHQQTDSGGNPYPTNATILTWLFSQIASGTTTSGGTPPLGTTWNVHVGLTAWAANQQVLMFARCSNNGIAYQNVFQGISATTGGPTGTKANILDGTAHWKWLSTIDFVSVAGAIGALPTTYTSNLTVQFWNDSSFATANGVPYFNMTGHTMGSYTLTLTAAPGESIRDAIAAQSVPLFSNSSRGVTFLQPLAQNAAINYITVNDANVIIDGIQFIDPMSTSGSTILLIGAANTSLIVRGCVFDGYGQNGGASIVQNANTGSVLFTNCLFIDREPVAGSFPTVAMGSTFTSCKFVNCTFIALNPGNGNIPIQNSAAAAVACVNCAFFGYTTPGYPNVSFQNCATDAANFTGGTVLTGNITGLSAAAQFVSVAGDFRLLPGSALIGTALTDTTDIPASDDIARLSRPQGNGWDIGCYERPAFGPAEIRSSSIKLW